MGKCDEYEAQYNEACDQWEEAVAAREAAEKQYNNDPTTNNLIILQLAQQEEIQALAAKNAAHTEWQCCLMEINPPNMS